MNGESDMRMKILSVTILNRNLIRRTIWRSDMRTKNSKRRSGLKIGLLLAIGLLCIIWIFLNVKRVKIEKTVFTESNRELQNPNRGFYFIYGFMIQDVEMDYAKLVKERYQNDTETTLTLDRKSVV